MIDKNLADYIVAKKQSGASDDTIRQDLLNNRWPIETINEALEVPLPPSSPNHIYSVGELFSVSFKMFKDRFWNIILVMFIPGAVSVMAGVLIAFSMGALSALLSKGAGMVVLLIGIIVLIILFVVIEMWGAVALMTAVCSKEKKPFKEIYKSSWKNILPFFIINFLVGSIILGGSILLIIPAFIFSIWFMFANYVLIVDGVRGFAALLRSREYARGHWWMIFGRLLLINIFVILSLVMMGVIAGLLGLDQESVWASIISSVASFVFSIYILCYTFQLFNNLRDVRGKFDLVVSTKSKVIFTIIGVIGFLAIAAIPVVAIIASINPSKQLKKADETFIRNNKTEIANAVTRFYAENNTLPKSLSELVPSQLKSIPLSRDMDNCYSVTTKKSGGNIVVNYDKKTKFKCNSVMVIE